MSASQQLIEIVDSVGDELGAINHMGIINFCGNFIEFLVNIHETHWQATRREKKNGKHQHFWQEVCIRTSQANHRSSCCVERTTNIDT